MPLTDDEIGGGTASCYRRPSNDVERIAEWLDTLPWKGPGSLHAGEIAEILRSGKPLTPGPCGAIIRTNNVKSSV